MLQCCICLSSVQNVLWLNSASYSKSYYWQPIGSHIWEIDFATKMNDRDLCLEVVSRSCQPLRYIRRWISQKPLEIEAWFQRTTNMKWRMVYQMVTWPITWPWEVKLVTQLRLEPIISKKADDTNRTLIGNGLWSIKWSRDRWCHVIPKRQTSDLNPLTAQYLENSWRCCLATIANY